MDPGGTSVLPSTFFFEQTSYRRTPKRYKKQPDELPKDLRYALLTPRVASYLTSKEKESPKVSDQDVDFGDGLGNKSLLPQINARVTLLQNRLNSAFSNDEDSQRYLFDRAKGNSDSIIQQLIRILYLFEGLRINLPKSLEYQLSSTYKDLTTDVNYVPREWQLPANREEYLRKMMPTRDETQRSNEDGHTDTGSISNMSRHTGDDDAKSVKSSSEKDKIKSPKKAGPRQSVGVVGQPLQDIAEVNNEEKGKNSMRQKSGEGLSQAVASCVKRESSRERDSSLPRPRTRLEKFKNSLANTPSGE